MICIDYIYLYAMIPPPKHWTCQAVWHIKLVRITVTTFGPRREFQESDLCLGILGDRGYTSPRSSVVRICWNTISNT